MVELLDEIKRIIERRVTNGATGDDEERFKELRRALTAHAGLEPSLPMFVRDARTLEDAWTLIHGKVEGGAGAWARRRAFVMDGLRDSFVTAVRTPRSGRARRSPTLPGCAGATSKS